MTHPKRIRIEDMAQMYAKLIDPVKGEPYDETARRLKKAIGGRAENAVFRRAVDIIRKEVVQWKSKSNENNRFKG